MKSFIILSLTMFACSSVNAQKKANCCQFKLNGTIDNSKRDTVDIQYKNAAGETIKDSVISDKPSFIVAGVIKQPTTIAFTIRG